MKNTITKFHMGRPTLLKKQGHGTWLIESKNFLVVSVLSHQKYVNKDRLKGFKDRHPELTVRKPKNLNPAREQKLNEFVVIDYFKKLEQVMLKLHAMHSPEL